VRECTTEVGKDFSPYKKLNREHIKRRGIMSAEIEKKLIDIIVEQLSVDREKVVPGASFVDDLGADSLDLVELIMAMEEAFDIEIADEVAEKISTVQNAIDHIKSVKG
jgi:acyl carrier protein